VFEYIPFPVFTHTTGMTHFQFLTVQRIRSASIFMVNQSKMNDTSWTAWPWRWWHCHPL